jgi:hypothetical protein
MSTLGSMGDLMRTPAQTAARRILNIGNMRISPASDSRICWGILGFVYFNAPQSSSTDLFWKFVHITCPLWDLPGGLLSTILPPFLNAGIYGLAALTIGKLITSLKTRH